MKMGKCILFIMCFLCTMLYAQEEVFSYSNSGLVAKDKFVSPFPNGEFVNITSHVLQKSYGVSSPSGKKYEVKCYKNEGWENEPGDWHYFEILYDGHVILKSEYADGWCYLDDEVKSSLLSFTDAFLYTNLKDDAVVLFFTGIIIMSQPPFLTAVVLKDGKATLVFNEPSYINKIEKNGDAIDFKLQSNTLEYLDSNTPINSPDLHTLILKGGMIYYK